MLPQFQNQFYRGMFFDQLMTTCPIDVFLPASD